MEAAIPNCLKILEVGEFFGLLEHDRFAARFGLKMGAKSRFFDR